MLFSPTETFLTKPKEATRSPPHLYFPSLQETFLFFFSISTSLSLSLSLYSS
ncbi:hypothetical protein NC652_027536 [Populus alba x Populus x berolinensis]|nr:hypothetical protein NC652_027536 [Populus alba x Populus x berolinensis]